MRRFEYQLFADYYQFYLQDESVKGDLSESWSEEAVTRLLAVAPGTVGVGTLRNMVVPVTVELFDAQPESDLEEWDHVAECSLEVSTGRIVIAGCTDYFPDASRIDAEPGVYRVRISYGLLDTLSADELDGSDRYRVQLWRASLIEPRIIKQRAA
jgi:hypothetical protein